MRVGLFPGQGISAPVVAATLVEDHPTVGLASSILGYDLRRGVEQVARRAQPVLPTALAQPAIFVAGLIAWESALERGDEFDCLIGHSLGEYTALVAGGAIPFVPGLALVAARGEAMRRAAQSHAGGMVAVSGLSLVEVEGIATRAGVTLANENTPSQAVLSGEDAALARVAELVKDAGGRCVRLQVEGPFHSSAMQSAERDLSHVLDRTDIRSPKIPVLSNVSATRYRSPGEIRKLLLKQLTGRVRFSACVSYVAERGFVEFVDLGPGRVVGRLAAATASASKTEFAHA